MFNQSFNDFERHQPKAVNSMVKVLISQNIFYFETLPVVTKGVTSYSARAADVDGTKTISHLTEFLSSHSRFVRRLELGHGRDGIRTFPSVAISAMAAPITSTKITAALTWRTGQFCHPRF